MKTLILAFLALLSDTTMLPHSSRLKNNIVTNLTEEQYDGPFVQYAGDKVLVNYINEDNGTKTVKTETVPLQQKDQLSLKVITDIPGKYFQVALKKKLQNEKCEFSKPANLFILSDIEGNFGALRKLLVANKIINEDFKWKFDNGHLVLIGDFFDRGQQVTELLWFIYSLEEKAKADGGYVHFILGNHEIMNLSADLRYVNKKYLENAGLLNQNYVSLYDENSELGRWLRTKNIVEKIGDILFTHGGISNEINNLNLSIADINKLARPYYADTTFNYSNPNSDILFSDLGPFWYRGYYTKNNPDIPIQIENTLSQYRVKHIITGHSIVSDTISVWYNGKLLNTDVPHAAGRSEALLIENDKWYRTNPEGQKVLLMQKKKR
jgi:hypothetical protein